MKKRAISPSEYKQLVARLTPPSPHLQGCLRAFWVGGTICMLGQALTELGKLLNLTEELLPMFPSVVLIFLGTALTGLGVYDRIGNYAGCGSIVPITGFANSVAAPALEFRREGLITGIGAKMFTIAGPVLVYGIAASIPAGLIYFLLRGR